MRELHGPLMLSEGSCANCVMELHLHPPVRIGGRDTSHTYKKICYMVVYNIG